MFKRTIFILFLLLPSYVFSQQLAKYRYWFDNNFNGAMVVSSSNTFLDLSIDVNSLVEGYHQLNFQSEDVNGLWSSVVSSYFFKIKRSTNSNSKYKYWFDNDFSSTITVTSTDTAINLDLNISSLSLGFHQLNFQSQDANGLWSSIITTSFLKVNNSTNSNSKYRYWYDNNFNSAVAITSSDSTLNLLLDINSMSMGYHQLNFQSQDASGLWSSIITQHFLKADLNNNGINTFRYWFDENFVNAVIRNVAIDSTNDFVTQINADGLIDGMHQLHYQFKDSRGEWSSILTDTINKVPITNRFFEYPEIYLTKAQIQQGEKDSIWGQKFTPNEQVRISIKNESQQTSVADTMIVASSLGKINFSYSFISSLPVGVYYILATDQTTQASTYLVRLNIQGTTSIVNRYLQVTSPTTNSTSYVNSAVKIEWTDIASHLSALISNTSKVNASYKIEYNRNNSGWVLIATKVYQAYYKQQETFHYNFTPTQTGTYQFRVTDVLDGSNTDTSPSINVTNKTNGVILTYIWDFSGNRPNTSPYGLAADGTSRFYVRVSKVSGNAKTILKVTLSVQDADNSTISSPSLLGKIITATDTTSYNTEGGSATQTSFTSTTSGSGNAFWFWYVAPDDFARDNNDNNTSLRRNILTANVTYSDNATESIGAIVEIVRPPLMLVHGWGGDEHAWDNFFYGSNFNDHFIYSHLWKTKKAVNMYASASFAQNAQLLLNITSSGQFKQGEDVNSNSFQFLLKDMRNKGYSANRVDYIAHSMGGLMGRTAFNLYSSQYRPKKTDNTLFRNYDNGFINKFITLNSPHNGSPFADILIGYFSQLKGIQELLQKTAKYDIGENGYWARSTFLTDANDKFDFSKPTEALQNLQSGANGIKFRKSVNIKNHLISGDIVVDGNCNDAFASAQSIWYSQLFNLAAVKGCNDFQSLFALYGYPDMLINSDFIVPLSSQIPGKDLTTSGKSHTIVYGIKAWHNNIRNSNDNLFVGQKTLQLLNASISSNLFVDTIAANNSPGFSNTTYRFNKSFGSMTMKEHIDTNKIRIISPIRMSEIKIDSSLNVIVKLKDTSNFKSISLQFQGKGYYSNSSAITQSFSIQALPQFPDIQTIVASAIYDSSGNMIYFTDTLSVNVIRDSIILGFYLNPKTKVLLTGQVYTPAYSLIHRNYISNLSISDSAIHINVADTNVVKYSSFTGLFNAKDTGSTYAIATYKSLRDTIFFIVTENEICPILSNIDSISGNTTVFAGQTTSFSILPITNATDYNWTLNGGGTITKGQNTNSVTIDWTTIGDYSLLVRALNNCGDSVTQNLTLKVSQVTAVINPDDQFQIKVVPNPSVGEFYLTAKGMSGKTLNVEVVNSLGQNMLQWQQKVTGNNFNKLIDLRSASDGAYYLKITVDKKIYLRKLIKIG